MSWYEFANVCVSTGFREIVCGGGDVDVDVCANAKLGESEREFDTHGCFEREFVI